MQDKPEPSASNLACAIVLAGGAGLRARQDAQDQTPKQYRDLAGRPLLAWSLEALSKHPRVGTLVLVLPHNDMGEADQWRTYVDGSANFIAVSGGADRRQSTLAGLRAWQAHDQYDAEALVLIHDGARPFVSQALTDALLNAANSNQGAIPTLAVTDTLKRVEQDNLVEGPDRSALVTVQTPQVFQSGSILEAHEAVALQDSDRPFTDDASIYEWYGHTTVGVAGDPDNIKITTPRDWQRAAAILAERNSEMWEPRSGIGYDVHRLVAGDGVWLCGHFIEHSHRLDGHSDADVGLHALTDALLGAIGEGDIGTHFPPSDPQWKGAASHLFLAHAGEMIAARGGRIANVDVAIIAEEPKVGPHREAMVTRMAEILKLDPSRVSVKATTNEHLGFAGRKEGIAALATATVLVPADE